MFGPLFALALTVTTAAHAAPGAPAPRQAGSPTPQGGTGVSAEALLATTPAIGEEAPDFTYRSCDMIWQHLHDMLEQGGVLLVFGPSDDDLRALERDRDELLAQGVVPVAVVERRDSEVWGTVRRLGLSYSLLADPLGAVSQQFGMLDPAAGRARASWFVIDRTRRVRGLGEGSTPRRGWAQLAAVTLPRHAVRTASAD